jgi:Spy/CpxP family protein refolding chaperone
MTKLIVVTGFMIAFAAGMVIGVGMRQPIQPGAHVAEAPTTRPRDPGSYLRSQLGLTPEQQTKMKEIWSATVGPDRGDSDELRRQYRKDRDDALAALLSTEQKEQFEQINKTYADRISSIDKERRSAFQQAVEQTKAILTPEQREKYEEILKRMERDRGSSSRDHNRRGTDRATSRPRTE